MQINNGSTVMVNHQIQQQQQQDQRNLLPTLPNPTNYRHRAKFTYKDSGFTDKKVDFQAVQAHLNNGVNTDNPYRQGQCKTPKRKILNQSKLSTHRSRRQSLLKSYDEQSEQDQANQQRPSGPRSSRYGNLLNTKRMNDVPRDQEVGKALYRDLQRMKYISRGSNQKQRQRRFRETKLRQTKFASIEPSTSTNRKSRVFSNTKFHLDKLL